MNDLSVPALLFIAFIVVQRLLELRISKRNTARLRARGAHETGAGHYPLIVAIHTAWIASLIIFGSTQPVALGWLAVYGGLQIVRVWILTSLGPRWTTRIIVIDEPLVAKGPYRFCRHPNYVLVVAEIAVAPLVLGLWQVAVVFTILNAAVLFVRIRHENEALGRAPDGGRSVP